MTIVSKPNINSEDVLMEILNLPLTEEVIDEYKFYDSRAHVLDFQDIENESKDYSEKIEEGKKLKSIYDGARFKGKYKGMIRNHYISNMRKNLCPYCNRKETEELEHYLPKSKFPQYSIHISNLFPVCSHCNKVKGSGSIAIEGKRCFVHPYYDKPLNEKVLYTNVELDENYQLSVNLTLNFSEYVDSYYKDLYGGQYARLNLESFYIQEITPPLSEVIESIDDCKKRGLNLSETNREIKFEYEKTLRNYGPNHIKTALFFNLHSDNELLALLYDNIQNII